MPVVLLLKLMRHFETFHKLCKAFQLAFEALLVIMFVLAIIVLTFASMIYVVDPREEVETLTSALWLTVLTILTVGYRDMVPVTQGGRIILSALIIISTLCMAIPIGITGTSSPRSGRIRVAVLFKPPPLNRTNQCAELCDSPRNKPHRH